MLAPAARRALGRAGRRGMRARLARDCAAAPPPPPLPLLSKARGEPRFSPPSGRAGERSRLARHMAARAASPDWFVPASSSEAHAATSPTPGAQGAAAAPWGHRSGECCQALRSPSSCSALRTGTEVGTPHPPQPPALFAHAQNASSCPTVVAGVSVPFRAPIGREERTSRQPSRSCCVSKHIQQEVLRRQVY
ncbi:atherin-like isoform X2 [Rhinolophus ferrumequinum]|uniref:atherin-like isoform X2 n=1 Tax=Rhinolophus ferrumequinum TaxID=59479 RepID=UPI00140F8306|nr:atherin-like isoform X2 [Rhinolophus ferrumequinum]